MKNLDHSRAFACVRAALVASSLAFGAGLATAAVCPTSVDCDGDIDLVASATSNPTTVTLSTSALPTAISYSVVLTHYPNPELMTQIGFTATTSVVGGPAGTAATFQSPLPAGCVPSNGNTTITCTELGSLSAGGSTLTFPLIVTTPTAGASVTLTVTSVSYFEDNQFSTVTQSATAVTTLTVPDPLAVSSYVPPIGAILYTGTNGGFPEAGPKKTWAATVKVPPSNGTTANIVNTIVPGGCASNLLDCSSSEIQVPGTFNGLTFVLRRDASTIIGNGKIGSAIVYYFTEAPTLANPGHRDPRINYGGLGFQVPACSDTTYGPLPQSGIPCIQERNAYFAYKNGDPKKPKSNGNGSSTGNDNDSLLYWEFIIRAVDNGRFTN